MEAGDRLSVLASPGNHKSSCGSKAELHQNILGPDAMYVKSVPLDDHEFIIERQHVLMSRMIKAILRGLDLTEAVDSSNQAGLGYFCTQSQNPSYITGTPTSLLFRH
uniref:Uncharacterized protein n=2 Tax=Canis lupus familiaris TaxID=9615 RepID=A0A8C0TBQ4_CANLF